MYQVINTITGASAGICADSPHALPNMYAIRKTHIITDDEGVSFEIDDGPVFDWVEIVPSLLELQDAKWTEIKLAREAAKYQPLSYLDKLFDFDAEAQDNINGAVQAAQSAMIAGVTLPTITWTLADNTSFDLTAEQLIAIPFTGVTRNGEIYAKGRVLRDQIYATTTAEQVADINW